jgi:hypothetical protein
MISATPSIAAASRMDECVDAQSGFGFYVATNDLRQCREERQIRYTRACPAKVGTGFAKKDMLKQGDRGDDDSKKSHPALAMPLGEYLALTACAYRYRRL